MMKRLFAALLLALSCTVVALAQAPAPATTTTAPTTTTLVMDSDSRDTRQQLNELLQKLPPEVGKVLKLDPSLWTNEKYLATYPSLAAFVAAHPDVAHSPNYYLENVWIPSDPTPETPSFQLWSRMLETFSIFGAFTLVAFVLTWLIRTLVEHRRWSRLTRTQADVHNKILDRFASNEDLLNYIQTPAGKRFLESAPIHMEQPPTRPVSAPIGRILWSVQAGIVTLAAGVGLRFVSMAVQKDAAEPLAAMGTLAIAIGIGLALSAGASFLLSRRLGLWQDPVSAETGGHE